MVFNVLVTVTVWKDTGDGLKERVQVERVVAKVDGVVAADTQGAAFIAGTLAAKEATADIEVLSKATTKVTQI